LNTLAIIGSNGMLGSDLVRYLRKEFKITSINRDNYQSQIGKHFDIIINANGNSKRFWANKNPQDDFIASTVSVYNSIFDFPSAIYVYISSPDVYENHTGAQYTKEDETINVKNLSAYGLHKYLSELIVKKYNEKFLILRSSMILGKNLKKGPFFDIIHNVPLRVNLKSQLQLITTNTVAKIIKTLLEKSILNEVINIGGKGSFSFVKIRDYFNKEIHISSGAETQIYKMNVKKLNILYPELKTSEEYMKEYFLL
jgi:dTDP-4-dehydrorhamnose reductase